MNHYRVVFKDGSKTDVFADGCQTKRLEISEQKTEYGRHRSFLCLLDFYRHNRENPSDFDLIVATFNFENIAGYYELSEQEPLEERETNG